MSKQEVRSAIAAVAPPPGAASADADAQERFALFVKQQNKLLSLILNGADLDRILFKAADVAETLIEGACCCVRLDLGGAEDARLIATRSLPNGYKEALDRLPAIDETFPLSAASRTQTSKFIDDLLAATPKNDPVAAFETAPIYEIRAAWAHPLLGEADSAYGALGFFFREPRSPSRLQQRLMEGIAGLAAFAIEHDRHRNALSAADARFAALADSIPGVVYQRVVEPDGEIRYTYISGAARELFGVSREDVVNNSTALFDTYGADYRKDFRERLLQASRDLSMWDVEATIVDREGQRKYTHAIARPTRRPDGAVVWDGVILDQTRIKEAEMAAAAAEASARTAILETLSEAVALFDAKGGFTVCNSQFRALFAHLDSELQIGAKLADLLEIDRARQVDEGVDAADAAAEAEARSLLEAGADHVSERRMQDGSWVLLKQHRTDDGQTVMLATDVTELKARERELARSNSELQNFASVASHDLQEPLRKIEAFGDRLRRRADDQLSDDGKLCIDRMQHAAGRMRTLINDLLSYSRVTTKAKPFEECDLGRLVSDVVGDLQVSIEESGGGVSVGILPMIAADPMQMRQLFQNIIGNAIKYRKPDTPPEVRVEARLLGKDDPRPDEISTLGQLAEITIVDNGIGFEMKYAEQIFTIFQRLHGRGEYEGTGIGLATVRKIVERHGGAIVAESEPEVGTTFRIHLPVAQGRAK